MSKEQIINGNNVPTINRSRTTHKYKKRTQTTGNVGEIIPFYVNELIQPGDTLKIDLNSFSRLSVSAYPSMDNLVLDIYFFKQNKNNLVNGFAQFNGENLGGEFEQDALLRMPTVKLYGTHTSARSLFNRLYKLPFWEENVTQDGSVEVSALPWAMYWQMFNDWFRDQNYIAPVTIKKTTASGNAISQINVFNLNESLLYTLSSITTDPYSTMLQASALAKACRFHDYFSSIIPEPQKGDPSRIPLTGEVTAEVFGKGLALKTMETTAELTNTVDYFYDDNGSLKYGHPATPQAIGVMSKEKAEELGISSVGLETTLDFANAVIGTMNDMRTLVAEQHFLEHNAIFGSREKEIIRSRFGVVSNSTTLHTVEYLGGKRIPLNMDTVLQTSSSDGESPQGTPTGYSVTFDADEMFTKSFDYWAVIMGVAVVRHAHTYGQGIPCQHTKFNPLDFWTPEFNNIGCQPIYMQEIYLDLQNNENNKKVWAYKMPWQEYREEPNEVTGMLSPTYQTSLSVWNYADHYETAPVASKEWLLETPQYVDRTLFVKSQKTDQLIFDFVLNITKVSEVTQFSIPGLDKF